MPLKEVEQSPKKSQNKASAAREGYNAESATAEIPTNGVRLKTKGCIKELWYAYPANEHETTAETESAKKHP